MWSASDQVGHVAVVTAVNVTGGNGTITVSGGQMSYESIYSGFQWTTNMPS